MSRMLRACLNVKKLMLFHSSGLGARGPKQWVFRVQALVQVPLLVQQQFQWHDAELRAQAAVL
ncbi:hypothetical protein VPNG_04549 [Cytospora leucostoma]|uniref:Uncharacterized protein n=1 Tax=Cytospora leucostoma TaxID=1230097 RepID=A0A423XC96_9PEZI|nr:hypothetical protein VPNG_04549 [Cytospora leucostoma]